MSYKSMFIRGENLEYAFFKAAIDSAKSGLPVWYISILPFDKIPENTEIPEKEVLNLITFIYLKDYQCLISHLNGIHLWRKTPRIIIIDKFEAYCDINEVNYDPLKAALICTSVLDALSSISKKSEENVYLIVSCKVNTSAEKHLKPLINFYFSNLFSHKQNAETIQIINNFMND